VENDRQGLPSGEATFPPEMPPVTEPGLPPEPAGGQTTEPPAGAQPAPADTGHAAPARRMAPTRASGFWGAVVGGLLVLVVLIVFILQNQSSVRVSFFTAHGHLPLGVALLLAAVVGGLVVVFAGTARILELRRRARAEQRRAASAGAGAGASGYGTTAA
jgi:uncharacterized integral membrane protein